MNNSTVATRGKTAFENLTFQFQTVTLSLGVCIVLGNILAVITLLKCRKMIFQIRILSINLAVTDMFTGLVLVVDSFFSRFAPEVICRLITHLYSVAANVSFLTITAFSVDRFLSLYFSVRYVSYVTQKKFYQLSAFLWIMGILISNFNYLDGFQNYKVCVTVLIIGYYGACVGTYLLWSILLLNFCIYAYFIYKIANFGRKVHNEEDAVRTQHSQQSQRIMIKAFVIVGIFMALYVPCLVIYTLVIWNYPSRLAYAEPISLTGAILLLNSLINPVLYVWRFMECRLEFIKLCCFWNKRIVDVVVKKKNDYYATFVINARENDIA